MPPTTLSSNLDTDMKSFSIPQNWKPRQALDYWEFLCAIEQAIWDTYEAQIVPIIIAENFAEPPDDHFALHDLDDDIPL